MTDSTIRPAQPKDIPALLEMIRELAVFEDLEHQMEATAQGFQECLFSENPVAEALICELDQEKIGYAIFYTTFSTFQGRAGIWLEDLYVKPDYREQGVGTSLLQAVGKIAENRHAGRYEWNVLDWNQNAINLYEKIGGKILEDWRRVRLDEEGVRSLDPNL